MLLSYNQINQTLLLKLDTQFQSEMTSASSALFSRCGSSSKGRRSIQKTVAMSKALSISALGGILGASYLSSAFVAPTAPSTPTLRGTSARNVSDAGASTVSATAATAVATAAVALVASKRSRKVNNAWLGLFSFVGWKGCPSLFIYQL